MRHRHTPQRARFLAAFSTLERFLRVEAASGIVLLTTAALALIWANSPFAPAYHAIWQFLVPIEIGDFSFSRSLHFWINDALMTVFFLVIGMEIRREMHEGALSELRRASLPVMAALGGVVMPALIYVILNSEPPRLQGWAAPTATDIAFAVGVLALLGRGIHPNVRIFLLALAIIDDIIAVFIIALFYSGGLDWHGLLIASLGILIVLGFQRFGIASAFPYVLPGAIIWFGLLQTGAHPTLAGVVLGMMTPVAPMRDLPPPVVRVQIALHPWVAYGIMPVFALANAGISLKEIDFSAVDPQWVMLGIALALVIGKPLGVIGMSWLMVRSGWCRLPPDVSWRGIVLIGLLAGVGFTMSLFIAMLAFESKALLDAAKLGILIGSLVAAMLGLGWGIAYRRKRGVS